MGLKAQKITSIDTNDFNKTIEYEVLHQSHVGVNHNKFYCLELQYNEKTEEWRLFSHYGRLNKTNIYDIRGPVNSEAIARKEYESILKKKKRGKKVKRPDGTEEREQYEKIETVSPKVGSMNIRGQSQVTIKRVDHINSSAYTNPEVSRIIDQVITENIHNITSNTTMTVSANGLETPLGPVTKEHVARAKVPLMELKSMLTNSGDLDPKSKKVELANNKYFTLIPHSMGTKITESDWILDEIKLLQEFDLLEQLETAVSMGSALKNTSQRIKALGTDIKLLEDDYEWKRIAKKIKNSKAHNHRNLNVWDYDVKNIFKIKIPDERNRFEKKGKHIGNIKELFHGSKNCNILSILKGGLIIPPINAGHVTGRMFLDGLYFANNSTKSLNYSTGWWGSTQNQFPNSFLFLADVALGKEYRVYHSIHSMPDKSFNSVHALKGRSLQNDEFIVYKLYQATLTYIIEMKK